MLDIGTQKFHRKNYVVQKMLIKGASFTWLAHLTLCFRRCCRKVTQEFSFYKSVLLTCNLQHFLTVFCIDSKNHINCSKKIFKNRKKWEGRKIAIELISFHQNKMRIIIWIYFSTNNLSKYVAFQRSKNDQRVD